MWSRWPPRHHLRHSQVIDRFARQSRPFWLQPPSNSRRCRPHAGLAFAEYALDTAGIDATAAPPAGSNRRCLVLASPTFVHRDADHQHRIDEADECLSAGRTEPKETLSVPFLLKAHRLACRGSFCLIAEAHVTELRARPTAAHLPGAHELLCAPIIAEPGLAVENFGSARRRNDEASRTSDLAISMT
jgi:hypothetical protein